MPCSLLFYLFHTDPGRRSTTVAATAQHELIRRKEGTESSQRAGATVRDRSQP